MESAGSGDIAREIVLTGRTTWKRGTKAPAGTCHGVNQRGIWKHTTVTQRNPPLNRLIQSKHTESTCETPHSSSQSISHTTAAMQMAHPTDLQSTSWSILAQTGVRGPQHCPDLPIESHGPTKDSVADGSQLRHYGEKVQMKVGRDDMQISFHVTDVTQPITGVSSVNDAGAGVEFSPTGATGPPSTVDSRRERSRLETNVLSVLPECDRLCSSGEGCWLAAVSDQRVSHRLVSDPRTRCLLPQVLDHLCLSSRSTMICMSRRIVVTVPSSSADIAPPDSIMALSHGAQPLCTAQQRCHTTILTRLVVAVRLHHTNTLADSGVSFECGHGCEWVKSDECHGCDGAAC